MTAVVDLNALDRWKAEHEEKYYVYEFVCSEACVRDVEKPHQVVLKLNTGVGEFELNGAVVFIQNKSGRKPSFYQKFRQALFLLKFCIHGLSRNNTILTSDAIQNEPHFQAFVAGTGKGKKFSAAQMDGLFREGVKHISK